MNTLSKIAKSLGTIGLMAVIAGAGAQELRGPPAVPSLAFSTPMPPGVTVPAAVETRLGTLRFDGGAPDSATAGKLLDNLDFQHAVQAYLLGLPPVNQLANRRAMLSVGAANRTVPIWEEKVDSRTIELTANDIRPLWIESRPRDGPTVRSSMIFTGAGKAPARSTMARSLASWVVKEPVILALPPAIFSWITGAE